MSRPLLESAASANTARAAIRPGYPNPSATRRTQTKTPAAHQPRLQAAPQPGRFALRIGLPLGQRSDTSDQVEDLIFAVNGPFDPGRPARTRSTLIDVTSLREAPETVRATGTGRRPALPARPIPARVDRRSDGKGIGLGRLFPHLDTWLSEVKLAGTSLPIAIGLLVMMYPVLAKVRYGEVNRVTSNRRLMVPSLVLNWLIGPALMFALAWLMLPDLPAYRTGLIIVGLARCIAMVLIWNDLAGGDREAAAVLVALNSLFQIVAFAALAYFYLHLLPSWLGLSTAAVHVSIWAVAKSVLIFLGIPLAAGWASRSLGERFRGRHWYEERFIPRVAPVALYGLLFTVVLLFALQGNAISRHPGDVARIALPLLAYFVLMWTGSFALGYRMHLSYPSTATLAFTAASNNFELAIAVAIGVFGVTSGQALAGVVGPLIEVPALVGLVYVALWARRRFYRTEEVTS